MDLSESFLLSDIEQLAYPKAQRPSAWYRFGQVIVNILKHILYQWDVAYQAPMPFGAKILVSNHPTTVDPILMIALVPEQMKILITEVLFKIPVVGASLRHCKHIRVDRGGGRLALELGVQALAEGGTVGIYPEGIVSPAEGGLAHFHSGAARLALASGAPIVPIGVAVQREKVWKRQTLVDGQYEPSSWYTAGIYAVTIGEPMTFTGSVEDRARVEQVTAELAEQVLSLSLESAHRLAVLRKKRPVFIVRWLRPVFSRQ